VVARAERRRCVRGEGGTGAGAGGGAGEVNQAARWRARARRSHWLQDCCCCRPAPVMQIHSHTPVGGAPVPVRLPTECDTALRRRVAMLEITSVYAGGTTGVACRVLHDYAWSNAAWLVVYVCMYERLGVWTLDVIRCTPCPVFVCVGVRECGWLPLVPSRLVAWSAGVCVNL
jgi:hypothetical protein